MSLEAGEYWRRVADGERIEAGDEYLDEREGWKRVPHFGMAFTSCLLPHRRRVPAAATPAPPESSPEPVAWGVRNGNGKWIHVQDDELDGSGWDGCVIVPLYTSSPTPHPWCSDVARDEANRAAEDSNAVDLPQHRDLPATVALLAAEAGASRERVEELRSRIDALEDFTKKAIIRETEPATESANPAADATATNGDGLREERATLPDEDEIVVHGNGLRDVRELRLANANLTAELDAAIRERDEARAKLKSVTVESNRRLTMCEQFKSQSDADRFHAKCLQARVAELEAAVQQPRGWLTDEDHRAVSFAAKGMRGHAITGNFKEIADQLEALLARSTPPTVTAPSEWAYDAHDLAWLAAIRAAGVEVVGVNETARQAKPASEAGTVRVKLGALVQCGKLVTRVGHGGGVNWVTLDLMPAQVAEIERQVSGEGK
jgi:hypothetical protein